MNEPGGVPKGLAVAALAMAGYADILTESAAMGFLSKRSACTAHSGFWPPS